MEFEEWFENNYGTSVSVQEFGRTDMKNAFYAGQNSVPAETVVRASEPTANGAVAEEGLKLRRKIEEQELFIKESMCIDGCVAHVAFLNQKYNDVVLKGMLFECIDSKRGNFYVGWYK